jgi:hypothetical protein
MEEDEGFFGFRFWCRSGPFSNQDSYFHKSSPHPTGVEDGFSNLNLGYAPLRFPNLSEEEKSTI